jgi:opacity protein-like surface antigen
MLRRLVLTGALTLLIATSAQAQVRRQPLPPARPQKQTLQIRGFFDVGGTTFTASDSFTTVLGSASGPVIGGGGGVVLPSNIFVNVRASRFRQQGRRVFVLDREVFDLGIENTVTVTPVELTGGYRFRFGRGRVLPYAGGGVGWYRYQETDEFAEAADEVDERFTGYHVMGGVDIPILKWLGAAAEVEWARVPDALGQNPNSVSAAFGETDLGGTTFRVKVVIGR